MKILTALSIWSFILSFIWYNNNTKQNSSLPPSRAIKIIAHHSFYGHRFADCINCIILLYRYLRATDAYSIYGKPVSLCAIHGVAHAARQVTDRLADRSFPHNHIATVQTIR